MLFKYIQPVPLSDPLQSRNATVYLYRAMKFIGWIPPKRFAGLYSIWTVLTFGLSSIYLPIGFLISYILNIKTFTPGEFLSSIQVAINCYGASFKAAILYTQLGNLEKAMQILDELDRRCTDKSEQLTIRKGVARCNRVFLMYTVEYSIYATSSFFSAALFGHVPWQVYNPFVDWRQSVGHLWLASFLEYILMSGAVYHDQLTDSYPLVFILIIRDHIKILQERIKNLRKSTDLTLEEQQEELVQCIIYHKLILRYCHFLKPAISGTLFVQILLCGLVLGFTLINLFFFSTIWAGLGSVTFLIAIVIQTFPFCYLCNLLIEDCEELSNTLFQSEWIDSNQRYKTTLLYFLHNIQQPIVFSAMGVFDICLASNISMAKLAFSVITIARQMDLAERFSS